MKYAAALAIIISLGGCAIFTRPPPVYSADEIDAINARAYCRAAARNMVEIARCDGG